MNVKYSCEIICGVRMNLVWKSFNNDEYNTMQEKKLYKVRTKYGEEHFVRVDNKQLKSNVPNSNRVVRLDDIVEYAVVGDKK